MNGRRSARAPLLRQAVSASARRTKDLGLKIVTGIVPNPTGRWTNASRDSFNETPPAKREFKAAGALYTRSFASKSLLSTLSPTTTLISATTPSAPA